MRSTCQPYGDHAGYAGTVPLGLACRRSSTWPASPSGPPVERVGDAGKGLGKGGQVPVIYTPVIQGRGELGQRRRPFRAPGDSGDGHFLNDADEPVDLDYPVDDLDGGAPGSGRAGEFPGPVAT